MKRRNFIKNTGLSLAGLALSTGILGKNPSGKKSLNMIILMSGGVRYNDIIDAENQHSFFLFQEKMNIAVECKTNIKYSGNTLEHQEAILHVLDALPYTSSKIILVSDANSATTKAISKTDLPLELIATTGFDSIHSFRNDAAVFEKAISCLDENENLSLILNLDDTDIAHCNVEKYNEVIDFYNTQFNALCNQIYDEEFRSQCNATLMVASVLGRNNKAYADNQNDIGNDGMNHYDESAKKLFCFNIRYASNYNLVYNHNEYTSNQILSLTESNAISG